MNLDSKLLIAKKQKTYYLVNEDKVDLNNLYNICTDCRAYLENPNDIYSKPLKCGYNPSESKWENWSKNPLKEDAIEHYNLKQILEIDKF